jgi:hypothetical protein
MTIKLVTFKTNHTIMGDVTESTKDSFITVKQPVQVVSVPPRSANDPGSVAFSPFLEYADEFKTGFKINSSDVLITSTPVRELENQYNQIFGSGIQIASAIPKI